MDLTNRQLGRYRILEKLGAGGMGEAFRARDSRLERDVAVKVLAPDLVADDAARRRLRQEALSLSRINHPSIATVHDFDSHEGIDFVVMELVDGEPLSHRIPESGLPEPDAVHFASEIADALVAAHAAGVTHRDLKPGNVLITRANGVKVIDFGLAAVSETSADSDVTRQVETPALVGTVPYMSPEQLNALHTDARSDLYSFGVVLYEMVTGMRPFRDPHLPRLMDTILHQPPVPARTIKPALSAAVDELIARCLAKDPQQRPQTAREVGDALRHLAPTAPRPPTESRPVPSMPSLVALPARVFGTEADAFLAEAIPNTLTTELSKFEGLDVKSPPAEQDVARIGGDPARVAAAYQVTACVVITVRATARALSFNIQLVEPSSRRVLWAGEYQGTRRKYVALLAEGAREICVRLNVQVSARREVPSTQQGPASELELQLQRAAYYGNLFTNRGRPADFERAAAEFEAVLKANPRSAGALEGLAVLHLARVVGGASVADAARDAELYARRALAIDPRAARAWSALSEIQAGHSPDALRYRIECALRGATCGPGDEFTHTRLASAVVPTSLTLAREASHQATRVEPLMLTGHIYEAIVNSVLGDWQRGLQCIDQALALESDSPFGLYVKTLVLIEAGQEGQAQELVEQLKSPAATGRLHPLWTRFADTMAHAKNVFAAGGAAADDMCAFLTEAAGGKLPFPRWQGTTAGVSALLTRYDRRTEALDLLATRHAAGVREPIDLLLLNDDFGPLRGAPTFEGLVHDAAEQFAVTVTACDEARARGELPFYIETAVSELTRRGPIASALSAL